MVSFLPFECTWDMLLGISIYFWIVVLLFWRSNISKYDINHGYQPLLTLLVFIHLLFAFDGGDFFNYYRCVASRDMLKIEEFYQILAEIVGYNYLMFRAVVWGGALVIFQLTARRFQLNATKMTFLLYLMFFSIFDYARVSLAMSVYFFGLSFICIPIKKYHVISIIWGILIILSSIIFHRSMVFSVLMTVMIFVPINRKIILFIFILFIVSGGIFRNVFEEIIGGNIIDNEEINNKISEYSKHEFEGGFSLYEWIRRVVEYATFFLTFFILSFKLFGENVLWDKRHQAMVKLYKVTLGLLMLAVSTQMIGLNSFIIFYRYLFMSMIPLVLLLGYARERHLITQRLFLSLIYLCLINKLFGVSKRLIGGHFK